MSTALTDCSFQYSDEGTSSAAMVGSQDKSETLYYGGSTISEIEEESSKQDEAMAGITEEDSVYVAVSKSETSMEALSWTLNNLVTPSSTTVYLMHVFPETKHIPNPLGVGMIPRDQVSAEQIESYMAQERSKRTKLLHKFLRSCYDSKVQVDTILIESDMVAKAILDLVPILHISKLVIGMNRSNLRKLRKLRSRKGNGIADQIVQNAPESCKVRIICEGREVNEQMMMESPSPLVPSPRLNVNDTSMYQKDQHSESVYCICFKPMFRS